MHKNDSLLSTLSKVSPEVLIDTVIYYYLVKEIEVNHDEVPPSENKHLFNSSNLYENRVAARLFYDQRLNELGEDNLSSKIRLQLFLVKEAGSVKPENYLLLINDGNVNNDAKGIEKRLFKHIEVNDTDSFKKTTETKNSFLHSNYKD